MSAGNNIATYCWLYFLVGDLWDNSVCGTIGHTYLCSCQWCIYSM